MKHTVKNVSDTRVELTVTLDATDLAAARQIALVRLAKDAKVAGFRPGKVPPKVAEKHLSPIAIENETLENAINTAVIDILTDGKIQALDRPAVDVTEFKPSEAATFTATVDILPKVKLGDYKKLTIKQEKVTVPAADVTQVIDRMRAGYAEKKDVERSAQDGDEVVIDFEGKNEKGEAVNGAAGKAYPLTLGSKTFIPGFEEGLMGKKAGDIFDLPLTFPKEYHAAQLAGTKVIFTITVVAVKEIILPELTDEFAKKCGPFTTVAELKADIKRELLTQKEKARDEAVKESLVEQLVKTSHVPAPEILVNDQIKSIEQDVIQNLAYRGQSLEQYLAEQGLTLEDWRKKELTEAAQRRVQVGLVLAELSKAAAIEVTKEELEQEHAALLEKHTDEKMRAQLDTPEARRDVANRLLTEKTVAYLQEVNQK